MRETLAEALKTALKTGDKRLDDTTAAGLWGLSYQLGMRTSVEPEEPHGVDLAREQRKLVVLANTLIKEDRPWQPNHA